jgi:hypothetical protein
MPTAYFITATAKSSDDQRNIVAEQTVYAAEYHWSRDISGATWFKNKQDAIDIIAGDSYNNQRKEYLFSGSIVTTDWVLAEITYDIKNITITDKERDDVIRKNALKLLSSEHRRVLGLAF